MLDHWGRFREKENGAGEASLILAAREKRFVDRPARRRVSFCAGLFSDFVEDELSNTDGKALCQLADWAVIGDSRGVQKWMRSKFPVSPCQRQVQFGGEQARAAHFESEMWLNLRNYIHVIRNAEDSSSSTP